VVALPVESATPTAAPASATPPPSATATRAKPTGVPTRAAAASPVPRGGPVPGAAITEVSGGAGRVLLPGVHHEFQRWNNCGPTTALMALSAFGIQLEQAAVQARLKPDREDTNVSPDELARFAGEQGLAARVRVNGNRDIVRALLRAGVPVIAEQWIEVHGRGEMGHYRVVIGYDDTSGEVIAHDSYYGANRRFSYDEFDRMWRPFLGTYVVFYRPDQAAAVAAAIGTDWDDGAMWARARAEREAAVAGGQPDAWAWFTLGTARSHSGDHAGAVAAFERAVALGLPFRTFWYQFEYYVSLYATGQNERVIALADQTLAAMKGENLEESRTWRGLALRALGREEEARADFRAALGFNPLYAPAAEALGIQ
jgi:tetratricopeptide (TPR) repeat protein